MAKRFIIYVLVVTIVSLTYADDENNSQDGDSFASLAQDFLSSLNDGDAVRNVIDAGMNAIKSAVVDEGVKVLGRSKEAKRFVKTGLDVAKALQSLTDEDSAEAGCQFQCPSNDRGVPGHPYRRPDHVPASNGCGSYGIKFESADFPGITPCCNVHDRCYDECGNARKDCDETFQTCLEKACRASAVPGNAAVSSGECIAIKNVLILAVVSAGCDAYLQAQKNACVCV